MNDFQYTDGEIYLQDEEGKKIAYIQFPEYDPQTVNVTHTVVDPSLRGQGVAGKLTKELAGYLRKEGKKAVLSCSYAIRWFDKHTEYEDVLSDPETEKKKAAALAGEACGLLGRKREDRSDG